MANKDRDTDPSSPMALGLTPTDPTPIDAKVATDPGLGPSSQPRAGALPESKAQHPGLAVAASSAMKPHKDSIEILLDGMQGQPERPKTTPQTDGQASAAYHAEHLLHPARTVPDEDEPKVVIDRAHLTETVRIDRVALDAALERLESSRGRGGEATAVVPHAVAPRVLVALVAGVVVVLALFVVLKLGAGSDATTPESSPSSVATAAATLAPPVPTASSTSAESVASVTPSAVAAPTPPLSSTHSKVPPHRSGDGPSNLGEFKTNYH